MTFLEAKAISEALDAEVKAASVELRSTSGGGPMGMTPDHVRGTPEWQRAKRTFDGAFSRLRAFNGWYVKAFKSQLRDERNQRRAA